MPQQDFLPFATDPAANVVDQATYAALAAVVTGYQAGLAQSNQFNKTWRQSSVMATITARFIADQTGLDVLDNGDLATLLTNYTNAVKTAAGVKTARVVTSSGALAFLTTDYSIGLKRLVAPAATPVTLPAGVNGQEFELADLAKNFAAYPVTVTPPGGDDIAGDPTFVCNVNKQVVRFKRYVVAGVGSWSVSS